MVTQAEQEQQSIITNYASLLLHSQVTAPPQCKTKKMSTHITI